MNKNSLKQMIVAEMILADVEGRDRVSPKKRSLFEMMDDSYLTELDDSKFVHSMKMMLEAEANDWDIANSDNPNNGDRPRQDQRSDTVLLKSKKEQDVAALAKDKVAAAPTADTDSSAPASLPQDNDEPLPATPMNVPIADADSGGDDSDSGRSIAVPTSQTLGQLPSTNARPPVEIVDDQPPSEKDEPVDVNFTEADADDRRPNPDPGDSEGREDSGDNDPANPSSGLAYLDSLAQAEINAAQGVPDADVKSESRLSLIDLLYDA
jgi:hypothetical protein